MDVLSNQEMVDREEEAFCAGVTAGALMDAAGEMMATRIMEIYPRVRRFVILVGKGNNGGDGLVVARFLVKAGRTVQVVLTAPEEELGKLPLARLSLLRAEFPDAEVLAWRPHFDFPGSDGVVIDALLGIQARGALRGSVAEAVTQLNAARKQRFFRTVALDLPTGLAAFEDGSEPKNRDSAVMADMTLAVGFVKGLLARESLSPWVGRIEVVPWSRAEKPSTPIQILTAPELAGLLPRRGALSYKGDFGRVVIVAGSRGFTGAPVLCAQAAQAMGAGLLSVVTRRDVWEVVAAHAPPEAMVSAWPEGNDPPEVVRGASAIVIGPGLGVDAETVGMLRTVFAVGCPVLVDADGLNSLAQNLELLKGATGPVLLTPHPGEMVRLSGRKFYPEERESVAREFVEKYGVTLVLKGTRTLVAAPGKPLFVNTTGNPGLSTGGSGDTLSGILGALLGQGLDPLDAARLGVWLHGHAADLVLADRGCEEGMTPTMLSAYLGKALASLRAQAVAPVGLIERAREFTSSGPA